MVPIVRTVLYVWNYGKQADQTLDHLLRAAGAARPSWARAPPTTSSRRWRNRSRTSGTSPTPPPTRSRPVSPRAATSPSSRRRPAVAARATRSPTRGARRCEAGRTTRRRRRRSCATNSCSKVFAGADPEPLAEARLAWHREKLEELGGYLEAVREVEGYEASERTLITGLAYHRMMIEMIGELRAGS